MKSVKPTKEIVRLFFDDQSRKTHRETFDLTTPGESLKIIALYCCKNYSTLDIAFTINHLAENTHSEIHIYGLLKDHAKKSCHLEINFQNGSKGSTGFEREEVFLLSNNAQNISEPIINCAEKNVKGSHGASIGHLDLNQITYLTSRGLSTPQAKSLLIKSLLQKPLLDISDGSLRNQIKNQLTHYPFV